MAQDIVEADGVRMDTTVNHPDSSVKPRTLWQRLRTGWSGDKVVEQPEKVSSFPEIKPEPVAHDTEQETGPSLHEFLTHKFFSSVEVLEQESHRAEGEAAKLVAEAYFNLRRAQAKDRSEEVKELEPLESYSVLSDPPSEEEKIIVETLLSKAVSDLDYPETVYVSGLLNPDMDSGRTILSGLGMRLAKLKKKGNGKIEHSFNHTVSQYGSELNVRKTSLRISGLKNDPVYREDAKCEILVAKEELVERVRDGEYS